MLYTQSATTPSSLEKALLRGNSDGKNASADPHPAQPRPSRHSNRARRADGVFAGIADGHSGAGEPLFRHRWPVPGVGRGLVEQEAAATDARAAGLARKRRGPRARTGRARISRSDESINLGARQAHPKRSVRSSNMASLQAFPRASYDLQVGFVRLCSGMPFGRPLH